MQVYAIVDESFYCDKITYLFSTLEKAVEFLPRYVNKVCNNNGYWESKSKFVLSEYDSVYIREITLDEEI